MASLPGLVLKGSTTTATILGFVTVVHVVVSLKSNCAPTPTPLPVRVQNCSLNPNCIVRVWADVLTR